MLITTTLRLARLIMSNLTLVDQRGDTRASTFMVDMNDLFERFVTERLRRALRFGRSLRCIWPRGATCG